MSKKSIHSSRHSVTGMDVMRTLSKKIIDQRSGKGLAQSPRGSVTASTSHKETRMLCEGESHVVILPFVPVGKKNNYILGRGKNKRPVLVRSKRLQSDSKDIAWRIKTLRLVWHPGMVMHLTVTVFLANNRRRDLDNLLGTLFDSIQDGIEGFDDTKIHEVTIVKRIHENYSPMTVIKIHCELPNNKYYYQPFQAEATGGL